MEGGGQIMERGRGLTIIQERLNDYSRRKEGPGKETFPATLRPLSLGNLPPVQLKEGRSGRNKE